MTQPARSLEFDIAGFEDLSWWIENDRKKALRIVKLIKEIQRDPFNGTGKPEMLKHEFRGAFHGVSTRNTGWCIRFCMTKSEFLPAVSTTDY